MSLGCLHQGYVDDQLLATGQVTKAVIMGLDGSQWAISANFAVRYFADLFPTAGRVFPCGQKAITSCHPQTCAAAGCWHYLSAESVLLTVGDSMFEERGISPKIFFLCPSLTCH